MDSTMENYETLYKEVCRICLSLDRDNDQMVALIEENSKLTSYGNDIETITQTCIENVKAPPNMCLKCLKQLIEIKHFIKKCESSQAYFENIRNCSEFYRKKIVVDTILANCKRFSDSTEQAEDLDNLMETTSPLMEETSPLTEITSPLTKKPGILKSLLEITVPSATSEIDEKTKVEFEIPLTPKKETNNTVKYSFSDNNTLIGPLKIKSEPDDCKIPLNQFKEIHHKAETMNNSPNDILSKLLKNNANIKIEYVPNPNNNSRQKLACYKPNSPEGNSTKSNLKERDLSQAKPLQKFKPVQQLHIPVPKLSEPIRKFSGPLPQYHMAIPKLIEPVQKPSAPVLKSSEPGQQFNVPVPKLSEPIRKPGEPVQKVCIPVQEGSEPARSRQPRGDLDKFKNAEGLYLCNICQKTTKTRNALVCHLERHARNIICHHCGRRFGSKTEMKLHLGNKHGAEKKYQCSECDFTTSVTFELKQHLSVHTGERPYVCDQCGLDFRTKFVLRNHLLTHREKTVQCPKCPLKFRNNSQLSVHDNNIHDRRLMYACPNCERLYARNKSVRKHLVNFHGVPRNKQGKIPLIKVKDTALQTTLSTSCVLDGEPS